MEVPYKPPKEDEGLSCPECGSTNVAENKDVNVVSKPDDGMLHQYTCQDCKCLFIPAMEETNHIDGWAKKIRMNEEMSQGQSWRKTRQYIIIKKKK